MARAGESLADIGMTRSDDAADPTRARLDAFLRSHERRALRMAQFAVGEAQEAMDVLQDVMIAFSRRYAARPESEWPPLFFRCLENRIRDWHRRAGVRRRWLSWLDSPDEPPVAQRFEDPATPGPLRQLQHASFGEALERALAALPHRQRQAFLLRTWEGLSVADTARAMGCGEGSVKTHLSRAMKQLRDRLGEYDDG